MACLFMPATMVLGAIIGLLIVIITLVVPEAGLIFLIVAMLLSPELPLGRVMRREVTIRIDDFLILLVAIGWLLRSFYSGGIIWKSSPVNMPLLLYIMVYTLSTSVGIIRSNMRTASGVFFLLKYFEYYTIFFMALNLVRVQWARSYVGVVLIVAFIVAAWSATFVGVLSRTTLPFEGERGEPNTLGCYVVYLLSFIMAFQAEGGISIRARIGMLITAGLFVISLVYSLSRSSYVTFIFITGMLVAIGRDRRRILPVVFIIVITGIVFMPQTVINRMLYTVQDEETVQRDTAQVMGMRLDGSSSARVYAWYYAAKEWFRSPLFGLGAEGIYWFIDAQYPKILAEAGVLGLMLFIWIMVRLFKTVWNIRKRMKPGFWSSFLTGYLLGLSGLLFQSLFMNVFVIIRIMEPFWFLTALALRSEEFYNHDQINEKNNFVKLSR